MSTMANFDVVFELSNPALLKIIKANWSISGISANPPFDITIPISTSGITGNAHMIVDDMELDLNADDTITIILKFSNASLIITKPFAVTLSRLNGKIAIKTSIQLVNGKTKNQKVLSTDLSKAQITLTLSTAANTIIKKAIQGLTITLQIITNQLRKKIEDYVQGLGSQNFPQTFNVVPGVDGSLNQFEKLEVYCIHHADRKKQALGFFGILLAANHKKGNHALKQKTAIGSGEEVCMSISPETFRKIIFCPAVARQLIPHEKDMTKALAKLPTACGSANGFSISGATLKNIDCSFDQGHIDFNGTINKSGFCYDADGSFHGEIKLKYGYYLNPPDLSYEEGVRRIY